MRAKFPQEVSKECYRPVPVQVSGQHFHCGGLETSSIFLDVWGPGLHRVNG